MSDQEKQSLFTRKAKTQVKNKLNHNIVIYIIDT